ncbi:MAG TPA: hypothetical protein VNS12_10590 [Pelagibacterium sp.]|uniref:hypothetical protein n=1 Tax=Pelagibacterium sp. TaxID=1967288 RepID=UPI002B8C470F|nr:hypothetical protein [Pelagibacterium sp.]HWJ88508.1 hypothetical protein [Pelagibacterium sp.]
MRTADPNVVALLQGADTLGLIEADLVVWHVKTFAGAPVPFAFWSEHDTVTATVTSPFTGNPASHPFVGAGAILDVGETPRTSDLSIRRKSITLSAVHETVLNMWTGHDMRLAQVAVYQALFDPETRNMASALLEFVGELNGAPKEVPAAGGQGGIRFDLVSDTRQLTRTNPAKRSDAHQRTRQNDGFHKYIGVSGAWPIPWGQKSEGGSQSAIKQIVDMKLGGK